MSWAPRKNAKKPGFTLLEVTIAITLVAVIVMVTVVAFAGTVDSSFKLREYSDKSFINLKAMEEEISEVKRNGGGQTAHVTLFGKEVEAFLVSHQMEGTEKYLSSLVVLDRAPEPQLPEVVKVINRGKEYVYLDEIAGPMDYEISGPTDDLSLWYTQWFIADPYLLDEGIQRDFSMPLEFSYGDGASTSEDLYPTYPNHFTGTRILGNQISLTEKDLGRHLVYHVQPVGHYGITGRANQSALIYAMGVPVVDKLHHHIDINFFAKANGENLLLGDDQAETNVAAISDMRDRVNNKPSSIPLQNIAYQTPIRSVTKYRMLLDGGRLERIQKRLRLKNAYFSLSDDSNKFSVSMNIFYGGQDAILFQHYPKWYPSLVWDVRISNGRVIMQLPPSSSGQAQPVYVSHELSEDQMHTVTFTAVSGDRNFLLRVDGIEAERQVPSTFTPSFSSGSKRVGGTGDLELTELVYYKQPLTATDLGRLDQYMRDKFRSGN